MTTNTDPGRALIADWRESAAGAKRYSTTDYEDGYAAAESNCANRLEATLASAPPSGGGSSELDAVLLARLGDDAQKWAQEFRATAIKLGYSDMDEGWLIGWFANAIEHSSDVRRWRAEAAPPSEPVGVEWNDEAAWSLAARAEAAGAERDSDDNGTWWTLRIDHFNSLAQQSAAPSGEAWRPMESAPRDGTLVRLLVEFEDHATEDTEGPAWTIGHNSHDNTGDDEWQFAGWSWEHDCYGSGVGKPVGWLPMLDAAPQQPAAVDEAAALDDFTAYFVKNYPGPDTIIGDPKWHAPRIFRAAQRALAAQQQGGRADG